MKTLKNLYKTLTKERIKEIILKASKGKKHRREVKKMLNDIDYYTNNIYEMIQNKTYYMLPTRNKEIMEKGKVRNLTISPFYPNRILDYIIVETLKPYIRKSMYIYCIGNVDNKGMVYGKKVIARKYKHYKYYIKLDIKKFYPSTKSIKLMEHIENKVKDKDFIELCRKVVLSVEDMPIGSYYSQWFSNWFLQDLDHLIKEKLQIPFYIRYVDDMLLMGNNKRKLLNAMYSIERWLQDKDLTLKRREQVYTTEQKPIDFLGFRFCENKIILRTRNFKKLNIKVKRIRKHKHICVSQARSLMSYVGWLKQIKLGWKYYFNHIKPIISLGALRRIISSYEKKRLYLNRIGIGNSDNRYYECNTHTNLY